jgi:MYXO-CTERM domain-containing protein
VSRGARRALTTITVAVALTAAPRARAFCPSYGPESAYNTHKCAVAAAPGENPTVAAWNDIFNLVSGGPAAWGAKGPASPDIAEGCGAPEAKHLVAARFPCELLKALTMVETGWRQFCVPDLPSDEKGGSARTIISFDCGYGIGQVTSGMHVGETPSFDRARVASDPTYNLATSTQIIAQKWAATKCVGDRQPKVIEHWYSATWAYNGLAYVNNPNNPNYDANRGVWDPKVGGGAPYQERVFGYIEHTGGRWPGTSLAYPNPGDIGTKGSPVALPEPDCASPTNCTSTRVTHETVCTGTSHPGGETTSGAGGAGGTGGAGGAGGAGASASTSVGVVVSVGVAVSVGASASVTVAADAGGSGGAANEADVNGGLYGSCGCEVGPGALVPRRSALGLGLLALGVGASRRRRYGQRAR